MLKYCLIKNLLQGNKTDFIAHVSSPENKNLDDVINAMIGEGSGLTRPQAMAYFEKLTQTIVQFVSEGHSVRTPLFCARPTITGLFHNKEDYFDVNQHEVKIRMSAGNRFRKLSSTIPLEKVEVNSQLPHINTFIDVASEQTNSLATAGSIAKIFGAKLKFDPTDLSQGVFFMSVNNPTMVSRAMTYSKITPKEVNFNIPKLESGEYILKVCAEARNKESLNSGKLNSFITI